MSDSSLSGVGFWGVVLGVFIPITSAALGIVWKRQDRHEDKDDKNHNELWGADDATQAKINAAYNLAVAGKQSTFNWWMSSGWVQFTAAQIEAMAPAVGIWVEEVYTTLQTHMGAIGALTTISAVQAYDFTSGWPQGT